MTDYYWTFLRRGRSTLLHLTPEAGPEVAPQRPTKTGNWVQLSSSCDIIRLLNPREMAIALNLPANYVSDLNCTDSKARTILGSAFGVKSIAHVLACLAGIGEA